jgi:hypothetical protein
MKSPDTQAKIGRRFKLKHPRELLEQREAAFEAIRIGVLVHDKVIRDITRPEVPRTKSYGDFVVMGALTTVSVRHYPSGTLYLEVFSREEDYCKGTSKQIEKALSHLL